MFASASGKPYTPGMLKLALVLLIGLVAGMILTNVLDIRIGPSSFFGASPAPSPLSDVTDSVIASPTATAQPAAGEVIEGDLGSVDVSLGYPSSGIPPLKVCLYPVPEVQSQYESPAKCVTTIENQMTASIAQVQPGTYHAFAWPVSDAFTIGGSWTAAVPCGLSVDCTDHSPLPVEVKSNQVTKGVEIKDWYGNGEGYPAKPQN